MISLAAVALTGCITPHDEVISAAPYLETSVSDTTLSPDMHFLTVEVRGNRAFTVTTDRSWITAESDEDCLNISIEQNTDRNKRSGSVILTSTNKDVFRKITITQDRSDNPTL